MSERQAQWIARTASRRIKTRKDWMRAVRWMVKAGFRRGANATTIRVAQDIAGRMGRSKDGHVAYCQDGMIRRLQLSERCVAQHVAILRELGLLVWVEQGSSMRNALRTRYGADFRHGDGGDGFARTATIYAPVAPRVWDDAMGRRITGEGYWARMPGVTDLGRELAIEEAREESQTAVSIPSQRRPADDEKTLHQTDLGPVDNSASCTPSVKPPKPRRTATVSGGKNYRPREGAARPKESQSTQKGRRPRGSTGWSVQRTAQVMAEARFVQLHTWWTQGTCVRQLAFALRPLFEAGWGWEDCARELGRWDVRMRPRHVASYVTSEVRRRVNQGALSLPDGLIASYRQAPAAENWERHREHYAAWKAFADRRTQETAALRQRVRAATPPGRQKGGRVPRGLQDARPENVLMSSEELRELRARTGPVRSNEELWAEVDEQAQARLARWEADQCERARAMGISLLPAGG
ncbi:hypothetical protein [Streptomyces subrutilus]|uniref:hypothetical protein n=1 Tax=Streptomyces subrutilus TaxID=36818 RepID=UPI00114D3BDF|nr:hypothetical protein [Streptomyces subrutilus]